MIPAMRSRPTADFRPDQPPLYFGLDQLPAVFRPDPAPPKSAPSDELRTNGGNSQLGRRAEMSGRLICETPDLVVLSPRIAPIRLHPNNFRCR
jgi:hypothetical protein